MDKTHILIFIKSLNFFFNYRLFPRTPPHCFKMFVLNPPLISITYSIIWTDDVNRRHNYIAKISNVASGKCLGCPVEGQFSFHDMTFIQLVVVVRVKQCYLLFATYLCKEHAFFSKLPLVNVTIWQIAG